MILVLRLFLFITLMGEAALFAADAAHLKPISIPGPREHYAFFRKITKPSKSAINSVKKKINSLKGQNSTKKKIDLGAAYLDYATLMHSYEIRIYEARLKKFNTGGGKGRAPTLSHRQSAGALKMAQKTLASANKSKKKSSKGLFFYGCALSQVGNPSAVNVFDELTTSFKKSRYAGDGFIALGEFYFTNDAPDKALREYSRVKNDRNQAINLYARYKMAWINFLAANQSGKLPNKLKALQQFTNVLKVAKSSKKRNVKALAKIVENDVIILAAELGDPKAAKQVLTRLGKADDAYPKTLERMAFMKLSNGDQKGAYKLYATLLRERPNHPENPTKANTLLEMAAGSQNFPAVSRNLKFMTRAYAFPKSKWRKDKDKKLLEATDKLISETLVIYASDFYRVGSENNNAILLKYSEAVSTLYLKAFPKGKDVSSIKYNLALIDYQNKKYSTTAIKIHQILKKDKKFKFKKDAAELLVSAAQYAMDNDKKKYKIPKRGLAKKPVKLPRIPKIYVMSLIAFIKTLPRHENVPAMLYAAGNIFFDYGYYPKSMKLFKRVVVRYPKNSYAKDSALLLLGYYSVAEDTKNLKATKKLLARIPNLRAQPQILTYLKQKTGKPNKKPEKENPEEDEAVAEEDTDEKEPVAAEEPETEEAESETAGNSSDDNS